MSVDLNNLNPKFTELFRANFGFDEEEFALLLSCFQHKILHKKEYYLRARSAEALWRA